MTGFFDTQEMIMQTRGWRLEVRGWKKTSNI